MPPQHGGRYHLDLMRRRQEDALRHCGLESWSLRHRWIYPGTGIGALATAVVLLLRRQEAQLLAQLIGEAAHLLVAAREVRSLWRIPYMIITVISYARLTSNRTHDGLLGSRWIGIEFGLLGGLMAQHRECVGHHVLEIVGTLIALDVEAAGVVVGGAVVGVRIGAGRDASWCVGIAAGEGEVLHAIRSIVGEVLQFWHWLWIWLKFRM